MISRKRTARRDSDCSSNSRQQDPPLSSVFESRSKVNNSHNKLETNPPHIEAQLQENPSNSQSIKKRRYSYERAKPNNTTALSELQIHNLPQSSSGFSAQPKAPKPGTSTDIKAKPKPESKTELAIIDSESESEGDFDSNSDAEAEVEAEAEAKGKLELIPTTQNEPKSDVDSKSMAKAAKHSNHSNAKEKQKVQPEKKALHKYVTPCVNFLKRFLPSKTAECDDFISVLNDLCIEKTDPSFNISYEMPEPERCDYCMKKYRPDKLDNHMLKKHWSTEIESTLMCQLCDSIFTDHLQFAGHVIMDHAIMSNVCICCNKNLESRDALVKHYRHEQLCARLWRCRFCRAYFRYSDLVKKHLQDKHFIEIM